MRHINFYFRSTTQDGQNTHMTTSWVQTPIAILSRNTVFLSKVKPLQYSWYWAQNRLAWIENDGHTAKVTFENRQVQPHLTGDLLDGRYIFENLFSTVDFSTLTTMSFMNMVNKIGPSTLPAGTPEGDEYDLDLDWPILTKLNRSMTKSHSHLAVLRPILKYSMEAHLVQYNSKYGNFAEALNYKDGFFVVTFFIQAKQNAYNIPFSKISDNFADEHISIPDLLLWMSKQELDSNYLTYKGSLTTETFDEVVTWIIYEKPVIVLKHQVTVFREMIDAENKKITNNYRPIHTPEKPPKVIFVGKKNKHQHASVL
ncbi:carbonic anhydrase 2-like [Sitodiplosis mosellana]|uniref:carbonic anhydrase 2-like n=1 Tax=Sitodiplosis mosellana TaxID=263140 RepID=UPI002443AB2B|nr:carbonic anhydrase 2-like [Sitodiplosis mosellana]